MAEMTFPLGPVLMIVESRVDPDKEEEFNRWYNDQHLPDVVGCPYFIAAARYRSSDDGPRVYLALYVLESEAAVDTAELKRVAGFGELSPFVHYQRRLFRPIAARFH